MTKLKLNVVWVLALAVFMLASASSLQAQQAKRGGEKCATASERAEKMTQKMADQLNLNEQQVQQVKSINTNFANSTESIKNIEGLSHTQRFERMQALKNNRNSQLKSVLTNEQYQQFTEARAQKMDKKHTKLQERAENMPSANERAAKKTERMTKSLGLNSTQVEQVTNINLKHTQQMDALRTNTSLNGEAKMKQRAEYRDQYESELQSVLSAEQLAQLKAIKEKRSEKRKANCEGGNDNTNNRTNNRRGVQPNNEFSPRQR